MPPGPVSASLLGLPARKTQGRVQAKTVLESLKIGGFSNAPVEGRGKSVKGQWKVKGMQWKVEGRQCKVKGRQWKVEESQ